MKNLRIPRTYNLISLDVVFLFTNTPLSIVNRIIQENWEKLKIHTLDVFLGAIQLTVNSTYFKYKDLFYQLAQLVLEDLEKSVIDCSPFDIAFLCRYIDDCLAIVRRDKYNRVYVIQWLLH